MIFPVIIATVIGISILGATPAHAQSTNEAPFQTLIQKIVDKFGLKKADVEAVFEEHRNDIHQEMQQRINTKLDEAVKDGAITEAQKQLIIKKQEEMRAEAEKNKGTWKNMTEEQRKAEFEKRQAEMKAWSEKNGINLDLFFGFKHKMGFVHRFMR